MGHPGGEVPIALIHHYLKFYVGGLEPLEHELGFSEQVYTRLGVSTWKATALSLSALAAPSHPPARNQGRILSFPFSLSAQQRRGFPAKTS